MSADVFNLLDGTRSSKRKPAPLPPVSPYSSRESRHVLASELTQCDVKGWLVDEVRGLNVWVVVADMLFCVFDSDESEISRNVVMLPGCRIRPVIFKSAPPDVTDKTSAPAKTITGIDKYQFLIDDVSTKRKLLFGVSNRNDLDMWLDVLIEAVSMDLTFDATPRCSSDSCVPNEECFPALDANSSYLPSPNIPRRSTISHFDNSLLKNGHTTSLIDIRRRMKRDNDTAKPQLQQTPLKATHDSINTPILAKKKGLFVNLKSFGSLDSLLKRPKRSRSADDSEIPERRSLDETKHYTPPSPSDSDGSSASCSAVHSRFPVIETGSVSQGVGPVVRRRVSDIKDKFFNEGTAFCGAPGVKLNELFAEKMSGFLQYRVMMKWIKVWCIVARGCFYGFKSQDPDETPIVAVVLKQCMVSYETGPVKANKEQYILKLSQPHCKSIYLSALSDKDLKRWLHQLKIESCGVQADDNISIENSSECTQSYDSAFSNVSMASSQNEFNDKLNQAGANGNTDGSPPHDDVFHNDYSPEEWDTYSNDSQNDTISELHDPFSRPEPILTLSARKEKGYLLQAIRSKFKMVRKKSLPEPIMERELSFPEGGGILMVDGDDTSGKYKKVGLRKSHSCHPLRYKIYYK
ncbi:hypothetical protein SNE40_014757 [Patella caerulea]|uniref:PH domain-containing protein n=1 Tax=Patella caerulea TaxID=87958 RepID=A0AAN8PHW6_PATCE